MARDKTAGGQQPRNTFAPWATAQERRPRLARDELVRRALKVLNAQGFDGLTMRRLAAELGVKAASLYNHVRNKEELLALMADAICAEIPDLDRTEPWREQLKGMAREVRQVLMSYRDGARVLAATPPIGPNRIRLIEQVLHALQSAGFTPAMVADAAYIANSYVVGFVLDETVGRTADPAAEKGRAEAARAWFKLLPAEYPTLVALADALVDSPADRRFELGLEALLDGFERRLGK
jgi:TetR/AcrR family transcriptional regulator, tetracycline repressor protein